jgi:hypothetical protein
VNKQEYFDLIDRELNSIKDTIRRKNNDYTGGDSSPFANFRVTEALGLSNGKTGVLIRMVDKIQRVKSFIEKGELQVKNEPVEDACRDIIGYSLILLGMLKEDQETAEEHERTVEEFNGYAYQCNTFDIKLAKSYKTRSGNTVYINGCAYDRFFGSDGIARYGNGKVSYYDTCDQDLVEEVIEEPTSGAV